MEDGKFNIRKAFAAHSCYAISKWANGQCGPGFTITSVDRNGSDRTDVAKYVKAMCTHGAFDWGNTAFNFTDLTPLTELKMLGQQLVTIMMHCPEFVFHPELVAAVENIQNNRPFSENIGNVE